MKTPIAVAVFYDASQCLFMSNHVNKVTWTVYNPVTCSQTSMDMTLGERGSNMRGWNGGEPRCGNLYYPLYGV